MKSRRAAHTRREGGQSLALIAVAFFGLLVFAGFLTDTLSLYVQYGNLKRAIDAAALGAATQFREGRGVDQLTDIALEFASLHSLVLSEVVVEICDPQAIPLSDLCTEPPRKFVRVTGSITAPVSFLQLIGIRDVQLTSTAESEAASVDVVLSIDTSESMTYDAPPGDPQRDPAVCNPTKTCHPFEEVRAAAIAFVNRMDFPYDRVAIVTFDRSATLVQTLTNDRDALLAAINGLTVFQLDPGSPPCSTYYPPNPQACTSTNQGGGLKVANAAFFTPSPRLEALWVTVHLSDGAANASGPEDGYPYGFCPATTWVQPFCRDAFISTRHTSGDPDYDADDYARDWAEALGRPGPPAPAPNGNGVLVFTIGLGDLVINNTYGDPNAGEDLLRFIASTNYTSDPCASSATGTSCGNYYFAPTGAELQEIFEAIASRIFTRLTN